MSIADLELCVCVCFMENKMCVAYSFQTIRLINKQKALAAKTRFLGLIETINEWLYKLLVQSGAHLIENIMKLAYMHQL